MTYAHVTTYRLGTSDEVEADKAYAESQGPISDQTARTIAARWHSPISSLTSLSHGLPFDTDRLREEINREITDWSDAAHLTDWLDALEGSLS